MKLLPARRPHTSQASVAGCDGGTLRPVHSLKMANWPFVIFNANNAARNARQAAQVAGSRRNQGANKFGSRMASRIFITAPRHPHRCDWWLQIVMEVWRDVLQPPIDSDALRQP